MLVCDLTSKKSFDNLKTWKSEFLNQGGIAEDSEFPFVVLGSKKDLEEEREVDS